MFRSDSVVVSLRRATSSCNVIDVIHFVNIF
jgi:hypothetical protein